MGLPHSGETTPSFLPVSTRTGDDSTGDFASRISRGLGMKVIRFGVNDDRLTNHFPHMEPAG